MSTLQNTSGTQVPGLEFSPRQNGDVVDDAVMAEVVRRLRFSTAPDGDIAGSVSLGFGSNISDASGNQIEDRNGLFVSQGAGLGVLEGNGLILTDDNKIKLSGKRGFSMRFTIAGNGEQTFTLPEAMDKYAAFASFLSEPGTAKVFISNKSATFMKVTVSGYSVGFELEVYAIELT